MISLSQIMELPQISRHGTGVYIAFQTTSVLKPIYRNLKTRVNDQHTKVGITTYSFAKREREYKTTFQGEVEFVPLAEVPAEQLKKLELIWLDVLRRNQYRRAGHAREWFETTEREVVARIVLSVVRQVLGNGT